MLNLESHSEKLAPVAEDVRDVGPQPVRQDAPLAEPMQQPKCQTSEEIARHELTHLPAATWGEACVKGRGREAPHRDQRVNMLDSILNQPLRHSLHTEGTERHVCGGNWVMFE